MLYIEKQWKTNGRNSADVKLVSNKKDYLKRTSKPSYMSNKIFDNKKKLTLTLKKSAYIEICVLELRKVLMYEFYYDYIKNKYGSNSRLLFTVCMKFNE